VNETTGFRYGQKKGEVFANAVTLKPNQERDAEVRVQRHTPSEQPKELFVEASALTGKPQSIKDADCCPLASPTGEY